MLFLYCLTTLAYCKKYVDVYYVIEKNTSVCDF